MTPKERAPDWLKPRIGDDGLIVSGIADTEMGMSYFSGGIDEKSVFVEGELTIKELRELADWLEGK
jgi:hypothetical protein